MGARDQVQFPFPPWIGLCTNPSKWMVWCDGENTCFTLSSDGNLVPATAPAAALPTVPCEVP